MKRTPYRATDHALVRYLERVKGVDVAAIRAEIEQKVHAAEARPDELPEPSGVIIGGFTYKLRGTAITTVAPCSEKKKQTHRGRT